MLTTGCAVLERVFIFPPFRYDAIREHIRDRYTETERQLVDGFMEAQKYLDVKRMKEYAQALQTFQKVCSDWSSCMNVIGYGV